MQAAKHNPAFAKKLGIPQSVAADFVAADKARGYRAGGPVMPNDTPLSQRDRSVRKGYRPGIKDKPAELRNMPYKHWLDTQPVPDSDTNMERGVPEPDWAPNYQKGGKVERYVEPHVHEFRTDPTYPEQGDDMSDEDIERLAAGAGKGGNLTIMSDDDEHEDQPGRPTNLPEKPVTRRRTQGAGVPNYQFGGTVMGRQQGSFAQGGPSLPRSGVTGRK